jgi:hypothetical protein
MAQSHQWAVQIALNAQSVATAALESRWHALLGLSVSVVLSHHVQHVTQANTQPQQVLLVATYALKGTTVLAMQATQIPNRANQVRTLAVALKLALHAPLASTKLKKHKAAASCALLGEGATILPLSLHYAPQGATALVEQITAPAAHLA